MGRHSPPLAFHGGENGTDIYTHHKCIDWHTCSKFVVEIPKITVGAGCNKIRFAIITTWRNNKGVLYVQGQRVDSSLCITKYRGEL